MDNQIAHSIKTQTFNTLGFWVGLVCYENTTHFNSMINSTSRIYLILCITLILVQIILLQHNNYNKSYSMTRITHFAYLDAVKAHIILSISIGLKQFNHRIYSHWYYSIFFFKAYKHHRDLLNEFIVKHDKVLFLLYEKV